MQENSVWKGLERRTAERIVDHSILLVSGKDARGLFFEESTRIHNVSPDGIAFFLKTAVNEDELLDLRFCLEEGEDGRPVPCFLVQSRVLRVSEIQAREEMFLVAARFLEDATTLGGSHNIDAMARRLENAIAQDEESRHLRS